MQFYGSSFKVNEHLSNITLTQVLNKKHITEPYIINYVDEKQIKNIVMKDKTIIWPYGLLEFENGLKYYSNMVHDDIFSYSIGGNGNTIFIIPYRRLDASSYSQYDLENVEGKFYLKDNLYASKNENGDPRLYIETEFYTYELWSIQGISIVNINDNEKIVTYSNSYDGKYLNFRDAKNNSIKSYAFNGKIIEQK